MSLFLTRFSQDSCLSCIFLQSKIFVTCHMMSIVNSDFSYNSSVIFFTELVTGDLPVETVILLPPVVSGQCPSCVTANIINAHLLDWLVFSSRKTLQLAFNSFLDSQKFVHFSKNWTFPQKIKSWILFFLFFVTYKKIIVIYYGTKCGDFLFRMCR